MISEGDLVATLQHENEQLRQRVRELEQQEARYIWFQRIVERCPLPIGITRRHDGKVWYSNPAYRQTFAFPEDEEIGASSVSFYVNAEDRKRLVAILNSTGLVHGEEVEFHRADGTTFWSMVSYIAIEYAGEPGIVAYIYDITYRKEAAAILQIFHDLINNLPDSVLINRNGRIAYANPACHTMLGFDADELIGQQFADVASTWQADDETHFRAAFQQITAQGMWQGRSAITNRRGEHMYNDSTMFVVPDPTMPTPAMISIHRNVTEQVQQEQERASLQERIIAAQRAALQELSNPLIPIADHVLVMPLIGTIDTARSQELMETLLEGIAQQQAHTAILDITGVKIVDTQVAHALIHTAQAVRLLGAQLIMSGISPAMAQTLVQLGINLNGIITYSTLQAGIEHALQRTSTT